MANIQHETTGKLDCKHTSMDDRHSDDHPVFRCIVAWAIAKRKRAEVEHKGLFVDDDPYLLRAQVVAVLEAAGTNPVCTHSRVRAKEA